MAGNASTRRISAYSTLKAIVATLSYSRNPPFGGCGKQRDNLILNQSRLKMNDTEHRLKKITVSYLMENRNSEHRLKAEVIFSAVFEDEINIIFHKCCLYGERQN
ncbi:hypothetical protein [Synechococcus sp. MIT S9504]|uniref:hypothetical protein n=1 Tax=Synechococcus sp. MIT S9504 TaxID=1801628 RepID=UPI0012E935C7|nr:hypothetical protein [Synechococcus sp. MIT S9504]